MFKQNSRLASTTMEVRPSPSTVQERIVRYLQIIIRRKNEEVFEGTALTGKAQRWTWRSLLSKTLCLAGGLLELRSRSEIRDLLSMTIMWTQYEVITGPYLAGGLWDLRSSQSQNIYPLLMANQYITGPLRCGSCEIIRGKEQKSPSALSWLRWLSSQKRFSSWFSWCWCCWYALVWCTCAVHIMFVLFYGDVELFFVSSSIKHQMGSNNGQNGHHGTSIKIRNQFFFLIL